MFLSLTTTYFIFALLWQDNPQTDFADLGKLMLGGLIVAAVVAISLTAIRLRLRDKKPREADFISINSFREKD